MTAGLRRVARQTLTIARRDFVATVFTPIFLVFLFAPVLMFALSAIGGMGAASVANSGRDVQRLIVIAPDPLARSLAAADARLRPLFRGDGMPPPLATVRPNGDARAQASGLFQRRGSNAAVVLFGPLERPHLLYARRDARAADYLVAVADQALATRSFGGDLPRATPIRIATDSAPATRSTGRNQGAFFAVFGVFFLTLFLSGQVIGTMAEERNTKVIEVLAAAVPLESVFLGKLLGMFGVAVLFVGFWGTVASQVGALLPADLAAGLATLAPAVGGWPFAMLFASYFTMAYLLLGSVFLGIGAQATTMREIQLLSLPVTIVQVAMFGLSAASVSMDGSGVALFAQAFPLSSPFAMAGRAAARPELWPHALALGWQALWVAAFITLGARAFRRGVLQSGPARSRHARPART